jgi:hypothetical protein
VDIGRCDLKKTLFVITALDGASRSIRNKAHIKCKRRLHQFPRLQDRHTAHIETAGTLTASDDLAAWRDDQRASLEVLGHTPPVLIFGIGEPVEWRIERRNIRHGIGMMAFVSLL